jgi:hypothetical protein
MRHIRQINSVGTDSYTVVVAQEPFEEHPSVVLHPDLFEISDSDIPEKHQFGSFNYNEVPFEVALWRIRVILKIMGLETIIETALESLPEPTKTGAKYIWQFGTVIERQSQTVLMLQQVLGMTNEQLDEMFIQANNIEI